MLEDIGHPYAEGKPLYDITFENVQAGERTSHLFRLANFNGALVVGTGDLSELALGWCTYGVGDHMSHYNVNASVPKTLIQHLIRWVAESGDARVADAQVLLDVLATEISPELVPGRAAGQPGQSTEAVLGPYELHDFFLYYTLRFGFAPTKVAFLACRLARCRARRLARGRARCNARPTTWRPSSASCAPSCTRFFETSQFKRSRVPNAPKVGSGGSLSPRGDWRAPSDGEADVWLADLARIPEPEPPAGKA